MLYHCNLYSHRDYEIQIHRHETVLLKIDCEIWSLAEQFVASLADVFGVPEMETQPF